MLRAQTGIKTLAILLGTMIQQCALAQQPGYQPASAQYAAPAPAQIAGNPTVYPRLNAPLYPSPVQYTPAWSGKTIITNQALAPVVTQQYNYGWGIPSSRITPISRPLPLGVEHP